MWEKDININEVKEIRTRTTVYFGVGAIKKIDDIAKVLKEKGILTNCSQINLIPFKIQPAPSKEHNLILIVLTSMNTIV